MPRLVEVAPDAIFMMVTNPVDIVTYAAMRASGLGGGRLFGSGTVLDSSRLRWLIAQHCNVAVQNVHAYMAGEHGDSEIPLWSSASVGSVPLLEWRGTKTGNGPMDEAARARIAGEVIGSAYRIIEGKGATNYAVAQATTRIIEAVLKDEKRVLPVSSMLTRLPRDLRRVPLGAVGGRATRRRGAARGADVRRRAGRAARLGRRAARRRPPLRAVTPASR